MISAAGHQKQANLMGRGPVASSNFSLNQTVANQDYSRNKYNTLTPAEARKLNRIINATPGRVGQNAELGRSQTLNRQPIRTASVLRKPRAPPLVTNLDSNDATDNAALTSSLPYQANEWDPNLYGVNNNRTDRSQSINYGRSYAANNRWGSLHSPSPSNTNYNPLNNKISDDSFTSARSDISDHNATLTLDSCSPAKHRSDSKSSLSSSTYKVFQGSFCNLKKFFRNIPKNPFANGSQDRKRSSAWIDDSSKSQSPTMCPPPPKELKSMAYMESAINYLNYDEFTRSRNERFNNGYSQRASPSPMTISLKKEFDDYTSNYDSQSMSSQYQQQTQLRCYDYSTDDSESWQLTSLPVSCERNLATVYEEKPNPSEQQIQRTKDLIAIHNDRTSICSTNTDENQTMIEPPSEFGQENTDQRVDFQLGPAISPNQLNEETCNYGAIYNPAGQQSRASSTDSSHSLASTTGSLSEKQPAPATLYRFSFAQPDLSTHDNSNKNYGLPPRVPQVGPLSSATNDHRNLDTSSGNSSNCSSQLNGFDSRDDCQPALVDSASINSADKIAPYLTANEETYNTDADTTIISETSTLLGVGSNPVGLANKCVELERTISSLKSKLMAKEKKLTDLELKQLNNDYTIDRLKSLVSKLEKENSQLKSMLSINQGTMGNSLTANGGITRINL